MNKTEQLEYGIQYEVIKLNEKSYILFPLTIIEGYSVGDIFYSDTIQKVLYDKSSLAESTLIDSIINVEKLKETYDFDDLDFLKDYYLTEEKDYIILVELTDNKIIKRKINVSKLTKKENSEIYERKNNEPVITLNNDALDDILDSDTIFEIKDKVARYKKLLNSFEEKEKKEGITSITVTNGHVSEVNVNKKVSTYTKDNNSKALTSPNTPNDINNFSVRGLEQYLKERVFGHDEQIRSIATKLIMNYRSSLEYGTESILLVGPTGTGKTVTILSAAEYFNLPFVQVNTANLVPQGIKGPSLEDYLYSLIVNSQYDINRAQRGFIFLDEFDKIGKDALDMKETVKQIFLKFIEGDTFMIDKPSDDYNFNTLFDEEFVRHSGGIYNAALDYGYAIILAVFNREVVAQGRVTQLGIWHDNVFNQFNLSSDLMEPFRPLIDKFVIAMDFSNSDTELNPEHKHQLLKILEYEVRFDEKNYKLTNAISTYTKRVLDALDDDTLVDIQGLKYG